MKYLILFFIFSVSFLDSFGQELQDSLMYPDFDTIAVLQSHWDMSRDAIQSDVIYLIEANTVSTRPQYLFWALLFMVFLGVLLHHNSRQEISQIVQGLFNVNFSIQVARWSEKGNKLFLWAYLLLFFYALVLGVWTGLDKLGVSSVLVTHIGVVVAVCLLLEYGSYKAVGYLSEQYDVAHAVRFNVHQLSIFGFWGVVFFTGILLYAPDVAVFVSVRVFFVSLILFFLYKEIRILQVLFSERIKLNLFYFFLYICTFKILPVAVVVKLLLKNSL